MSEEVEVTIQTSGKVAFKVKGAKGKGCINLTRELETLLGKVQKSTLSSEYFEMPIRGEIKTNISPEFSD